MCIFVWTDIFVCAGRVEGGWREKEAEMWLFLDVYKNSMINTEVCMLLYCNDCHFKTSFLPSSYRGKDLRENYCRNPRGEEGGPWCFTTSPETRHEVCDIPLCSEGNVAVLMWKVAFLLYKEQVHRTVIFSNTHLCSKERWFLIKNECCSNKSSC